MKKRKNLYYWDYNWDKFKYEHCQLWIAGVWETLHFVDLVMIQGRGSV